MPRGGIGRGDVSGEVGVDTSSDTDPDADSGVSGHFQSCMAVTMGGQPARSSTLTAPQVVQR